MSFEKMSGFESNHKNGDYEPYLADAETRARLEKSMNDIIEQGDENPNFSEEYLNTVKRVLAQVAMENQKNKSESEK